MGEGKTEHMFRLPALAELTVDQRERMFPFRDGAWSEQTRAAMAQFKTEKLDLNEPWAATPRGWRCPACQRVKAEIFRVTAGEVLTAHLHKHHDHLQDHLTTLMKVRLGPDAKRSPDYPHREVFRLSRALRRFDESIVCEDCNTADGSAKAALGLPRHFSFSPVEIGQFIKVRPHQPHSLDLPAVRRVFDSVAVDFELRTAMFGKLADRLANGGLRQEKSNGLDFAGANALTVEGQLSRTCALYAPEVHMAFAKDLSAFGRASTPTDGVRKRTTARRRKVEIPSAEEIAAFTPSTLSETWVLVPEDWTCPICDRSKVEIIRRGNKDRKWTGHITRHYEYVFDRVFNRSEGVAEDRVTHRETHFVCGECADMKTRVKQAASELSCDSLFFTIEQYRSVCESAPHQALDVDVPTLVKIGHENMAVADEVEAFQRHFSEVVSWSDSYLSRRVKGMAQARAWIALRASYAKVKGAPAEELEAALRLVVEEGLRLSELDRQFTRPMDLRCVA
ncbi:hypothetical protein [Asticcacaulis sp. W401b]|uniref:hypothetical protein n=1 Tax=Asticcacaulis sp. W401b TaxID=3388666 RepID=UPI0039707322